MTYGETENIPFSIGWTWFVRKNKGHTIVRNFASFVDLIFGILLSKVFLYWNNNQLRVKQNILWIKWIMTLYVNRFIVKIPTYYPMYIRLASLRPDSGVYTLAAHIFINPQSYLYVTFKNELIFFPLQR